MQNRFLYFGSVFTKKNSDSVRNEFGSNKTRFGLDLFSVFSLVCFIIARQHTDARSLSFFIFILWGSTRSLRMPTLRPASQAGPMRNPREGTSVVLRDTIRLTDGVCSV